MSNERKYNTSRYKYTGPTMLLGKYDNIELHKGCDVEAEVNINVATITKIYDTDGSTAVLNDATTVIASKYLEYVKPEPIHFDSKHFFDDLYADMAYKWDELHREPTKETLDNLRKFAREHKGNIEVGGDHYQTAIQPWDFIYANHIPFDESCIIKYACRHQKKGGVEDVKKIISYAKHILKTQYGIDYGTDNE